MKKNDYEQKIGGLFERWKQARPNYGNDFVHDGIVDFEKWCEAKPKVLYLLKEAYLDDGWEPDMGITNTVGNRFSKNIARWHNVLKELYQDYAKEPSYNVVNLPKEIVDIALIEVKKVNQGRSTSESRDINSFAANDKVFLQEQIEIINPQVIVCCGTIDAYGEIIYGNEKWDDINVKSEASLSKESDNKRFCYKHRGRLVIDFYHPTPIGRSDEDLFAMFCCMIKNGKVFDAFDWK